MVLFVDQWHNVRRMVKNRDDVIKWTHFLRYWPFVRGNHRSLVNSSHKGQWCGALLLSFICAWTIVWVNNRDAGDLRRHHAHYEVILTHKQLNILFQSIVLFIVLFPITIIVIWWCVELVQYNAYLVSTAYWWVGTRTSITTVLSRNPCVSSCLWVKKSVFFQSLYPVSVFKSNHPKTIPKHHLIF